MKHEKMVGQKMKSFNFLSTLGEGAWAVVYEAIDERDGNQVAVKVIPRSLISQTPKLGELVKTEIRVLRNCKNENVIRFIDSFMSQKSIFIAMQYCDGGDLEHYLEKKKRLAEDQATMFLKQIINGFKGLHQVNAMHRDFKVANVLLHKGVCKIADLGFAKQMEKKSMTKTILGTSLTMAPEVLGEKPYGLEADIWSLAVVYYQLIYGKYPYMGMNDYDILKKIKLNRPDFSGVNISENTRNFIDKCLTVNPQQRISWRQIYEHPLIKNQQKIIYNVNNLKSKINLGDNVNFYDKEKPIVNPDLMYVEKKNEKKEQDFYTEVEVRNSLNYDKMKQQTLEKKQKQQSFAHFDKIYLNRRNNIMFIFKYITPYINNFIYKINANHAITMFIISKKAYHDMKKFVDNLIQQVNFLKLNPKYFPSFTKSISYENMISMTLSDVDQLNAQMTTYKEFIEHCSPEIKDEFNVDKIVNKNWGVMFDETISSYQWQLGEHVEKFEGQEKGQLIKIIETLNYLKLNQENTDIEDFERKMQMINYTQSQSKIKAKLQSIFG